MRYENYDPDVLYKIDQLQVWRDILGIPVVPKQRICNPFRVDTNPGAWLDWYRNKLVLKDFAYQKHIIVDLVQAVMIIYNLSYHQAIKKLDHWNKYEGKITRVEIPKNKVGRPSNQVTRIEFKARNWSKKDKKYWYDTRYISKDQLIEDGVIPISEFSIGNTVFNAADLSYVIYNKNGRIKLYQPLEPKTSKWFSNINKNDYWFFSQNSNVLVITKGYKECRHVLNLTSFDVLSLHSEEYKFTSEILELVSQYDKIYVLFDNDATGKKRSCEIAEEVHGECINLPEVYNDLDEMVIWDHYGAMSYLNTM